MSRNRAQRTLTALLLAIMPMLEGAQFHSAIRRVGTLGPQSNRFIRGTALVYALNVRLGWVATAASLDVQANRKIS